MRHCASQRWGNVLGQAGGVTYMYLVIMLYAYQRTINIIYPDHGVRCFAGKVEGRCKVTMCSSTFESDITNSFPVFLKSNTCTHGKRQHPSWCSICTVHPSPCILWQIFASSDDRSPLHRRWRPVRSSVCGRSCSPSVWSAISCNLRNSAPIVY